MCAPDEAKRFKASWASVVSTPTIVKEYDDGLCRRPSMHSVLESVDAEIQRKDQEAEFAHVAHKVVELMIARVLARPLKPKESRVQVLEGDEQTASLATKDLPPEPLPGYLMLWVQSVKKMHAAS